MSLKGQLYKSIRSMPNCIAGGYIDLDAKALVAMLTVEPITKDVLSNLAGITVDLFQGQNVLVIEEIFKKSRGDENSTSHLFQEMIVSNESLMHIFIRGRSSKNHIITFVSKTSTNVMLSLVNARAEVLKLEAAFRADLVKR